MFTRADTTQYEIACLDEPSIASSKYCNYKIDQATTPSNIMIVYGVEVAN